MYQFLQIACLYIVYYIYVLECFFNSNFSVLISSCNFDVGKNSLCVYVRYEYTEWRHWSRAAPEL
jgi:hypothetical protein